MGLLDLLLSDDKKKKDEKLEKEMDKYDLEEWQKKLVRERKIWSMELQYRRFRWKWLLLWRW